uniref:Histone domain-containing protein n=2 Tax=Mesocestoides corti TaxID=53468 RepID=A0A5K3G6Y3_MESCO
VGETTGKSRHLTGRVCPFCVPASSVDSPSNSLVQKLATGANSLATRRSKSSRASLDRVLAFKRAATSLRRIHAKRNRHNCSLPLMRDVIVHYFERQPVAGQAEIYRVDRAVAALYGSGIGERIKDETAGGPSKRSRLTTPSDFHSWPLRLQRALTNVPLP